MLTEKQKLFVDHYLAGGSGFEAYLKAYPNTKSKNCARVNAHNLLKSNKIKEYIQDQIDKAGPEIANAEEVLKYLTKVMRREYEEEVVSIVGTGEGTSKVEKVMKQVGVKDSNKAAELLGKRYRLFTEKQEVSTRQVVEFVGENTLED